MHRRRRPYVKPVRRLTPAAVALAAARRAARFRLDHTANALGVHPRTFRRWELGETHPSPDEWSRLAAFFAAYAPQAARDLAAAANVPSPIPEPAAVDARAIEAAIYRAADRLDVAPRRVRAALRELAATVAHVGGTLDDLARVAQDSEPRPADEPVARDRERG